jgi:hypothetical protein
MLERGQLSPYLCQGVIFLLPNVKGMPTALQLRPIMLLNTDYKHLTKVFVKRLLTVLPSVLCRGPLCSIKGRNIMQRGHLPLVNFGDHASAQEEGVIDES